MIKLSNNILLVFIFIILGFTILVGCSNNKSIQKENISYNSADTVDSIMVFSEEIHKVVTCIHTQPYTNIGFFGGEEMIFEMSLINYDEDKQRVNENNEMINIFIDKVENYYSKKIALISYADYAEKIKNIHGDNALLIRRFYFENGDTLVWNYKTWETYTES